MTTNFLEFNKEILGVCSEIGVSLEERQVKQFYQYLNLFKKWASTMNLSTILEDKEIVVKHFADSLLCLSLLKGKKRIADVGSGAGFPGLPLKIAKPSLVSYFLESKRKKVSFLKQVIRTLGLKSAYAVTLHVDLKSSEQLGSIFTKPVDAFLLRAVKPTQEILQAIKPHLSDKGEVLFFSSQEESALTIQGELGDGYSLAAKKKAFLNNQYERVIYSIQYR